jgi:predicted peptidase
MKPAVPLLAASFALVSTLCIAADAGADSYAPLLKSDWVHQRQPVAAAGLPFWLHADPKLVRDGKRHPLIVVLHGRRNNVEDGAEFKVQPLATAWTDDKVRKAHPCFVVQPYYPPKSGWEDQGAALDSTVADIMRHLPVDPARVYLVGFSNGGQGTFLTLARQPGIYAAAVTVSGPVAPKDVVGKIKAPIWSWVGEEDHELNKVGRVKQLAKALQDAGADVKLNVVPGAGHACFGKAVNNAEVHAWLFSKRLPSRP